MRKIKLLSLEQFHTMQEINERDFVLWSRPCPELWKRKQQGYCVLAELTHLQGLSEEQVAEALCKEEAVSKYPFVCIDITQLPQAYLRRIWCITNKLPVEIAETKRLLLRESVPEDAEAFYRLYKDEDCQKYLKPLPIDKSLPPLEAYARYIQEYIRGQYGFYEYGMWTVVEKADGSVIGRAGLENQKIEGTGEKLCLGYGLLPQYRGAGYALEALEAILYYCMECDYATEVWARISKENNASCKVARVLQTRNILPVNIVSD